MTGLVLLVVMLGLMWAVVIFPQQRRVKAHQRLCDAVETGNVVMTTAGVFGAVVDAGPDRLVLQTSPGVHTVVDRRSIGMIVPAGTSLDDLGDVSTPTPEPFVPEGVAGGGLLGLGAARPTNTGSGSDGTAPERSSRDDGEDAGPATDPSVDPSEAVES